MYARTYLHDGAHELVIDHPDDLPPDTARMLARAAHANGGRASLTVEGTTWDVVLERDRCTIWRAESSPR